MTQIEKIAGPAVPRELRALADKVIEIWGERETTNTIVAGLRIGANEVEALTAEVTRLKAAIGDAICNLDDIPGTSGTSYDLENVLLDTVSGNQSPLTKCPDCGDQSFTPDGMFVSEYCEPDDSREK